MVFMKEYVWGQCCVFILIPVCLLPAILFLNSLLKLCCLQFSLVCVLNLFPVLFHQTSTALERIFRLWGLSRWSQVFVKRLGGVCWLSHFSSLVKYLSQCSGFMVGHNDKVLSEWQIETSALWAKHPVKAGIVSWRSLSLPLLGLNHCFSS